MIEIEKIKPVIEKLAKKYHLSLVLLFGSQVSGKTHKHSDFDVAFLSAKKIDLMDEAKLACDLMPVFKSDQVDLVNLKNAPPLLMKKIFDNHLVLFCQDENIYYAYQIYALKRYIEVKPLFKLRSDYLHYRIKKYQKELKYV